MRLRPRHKSTRREIKGWSHKRIEAPPPQSLRPCPTGQELYFDEDGKRIAAPQSVRENFLLEFGSDDLLTAEEQRRETAIERRKHGLDGRF
jgi:hypothetical protein